ncbi:MAG: hypothetical protein ACO27O_10960 [Hylemonella sp.]
MPYYIYRIKPFSILEMLGTHDAFAAASAQATLLRAGRPQGSPDRIKVMFADNPLQAEDLLSQVREPRPTGEE